MHNSFKKTGIKLVVKRYILTYNINIKLSLQGLNQEIIKLLSHQMALKDMIRKIDKKLDQVLSTQGKGNYLFE